MECNNTWLSGTVTFQVLRFCVFLSRLLTQDHPIRTDLCAAAFTHSSPRFSPPKTNVRSNVLPLFLPPNTTSAHLGQGFRNFPHSADIFEDFLYIINDVRCLTVVVNLSNASGCIDSTWTSFWQMCDLVERRLIYLLDEVDPAAIADKYCLHTLDSTRLAVLIFCQLVLRRTPPASSICVKLFHDLRVALELTELNESWDRFAALLSWVLFMGAAAAQADTERAWFIGHFIRTNLMLGLQNVDEVKRNLVKFLWDGCVCARAFQFLTLGWDEERFHIPDR
jgi:Fungal specific transcription factor domain